VLGIILPEPLETVTDDFEVLEENWPVVEMFLRVQTQWRTTMGGVLGLDYGAVAWLFKMYAVEDPRSLLEDLQIMEAAAMQVINSRSS
jgi:ABC-type thiamine transport system substrate-binding protein